MAGVLRRRPKSSRPATNPRFSQSQAEPSIKTGVEAMTLVTMNPVQLQERIRSARMTGAGTGVATVDSVRGPATPCFRDGTPTAGMRSEIDPVLGRRHERAAVRRVMELFASTVGKTEPPLGANLVHTA